MLKQKKQPKTKLGYETGKGGLTFWTTDIKLLGTIKKFLGIK